MPTLQLVRAVADARLTVLWTDHIRPRQDAYFAAHGRYWQGLVTSSIPEDGAEAVADYTSSPTDQAETWADIFGAAIGMSLPVALAVDVYEGPQGHGFVARVWIRYDGTVYMRAQNHGLESWRTAAWAVQLPEGEM